MDVGCKGITFNNGTCYKLMDSGGSVLADSVIESIPALLFNSKCLSLLSSGFRVLLKNLFCLGW